MLSFLAEICQFSDDQTQAWSKLFDQVYSWMFEILGDHAKGDNTADFDDD